MEVPRLGVELELQLPAYTTAAAMWDPSCVYAICTTAMLDPYPTEQGQGLNPHPHGYLSDSIPLRHNGNSSFVILCMKPIPQLMTMPDP